MPSPHPTYDGGITYQQILRRLVHPAGDAQQQHQQDELFLCTPRARHSTSKCSLQQNTTTSTLPSSRPQRTVDPASFEMKDTTLDEENDTTMNDLWARHNTMTLHEYIEIRPGPVPEMFYQGPCFYSVELTRTPSKIFVLHYVDNQAKAVDLLDNIVFTHLYQASPNFATVVATDPQYKKPNRALQAHDFELYSAQSHDARAPGPSDDDLSSIYTCSSRSSSTWASCKGQYKMVWDLDTAESEARTTMHQPWSTVIKRNAKSTTTSTTRASTATTPLAPLPQTITPGKPKPHPGGTSLGPTPVVGTTQQASITAQLAATAKRLNEVTKRVDKQEGQLSQHQQQLHTVQTEHSRLTGSFNSFDKCNHQLQQQLELLTTNVTKLVFGRSSSNDGSHPTVSSSQQERPSNSNTPSPQSKKQVPASISPASRAFMERQLGTTDGSGNMMTGSHYN